LQRYENNGVVGKPSVHLSVYERLQSCQFGVAGRPKGNEGLSNPIATTNRGMLAHRLLIDMQDNRPRGYQSLWSYQLSIL